MLKIVNLVGARPQFIKAAAISRVLKNTYSSQVEDIVVHSGQHYDNNLSAVFFDELSIAKPLYNLNVGSGTHANQTGLIMQSLEKLFFEIKPDALIVYGDTNTTLAGAIVASKMGIKLAHVEGGLRSNNKLMPEEINRIATDAISDFIFCPTENAVKNIFASSSQLVLNSGDVMLDTCNHYLNNLDLEFLEKHQLTPNNYALCTVHRDFNTDNKKRLSSILGAIELLGNEIDIVLPLHPRTLKQIEFFGIQTPKNIKTITPVSYLEMLTLETNSKIILTDSGGVQKEAYFLNKPSIIFRSETEWVEIVESKCTMLCDANQNKIIEAYHHFMENPPSQYPEVYGLGNAAEIICKTLVESL